MFFCIYLLLLHICTAFVPIN